ncbi:hypothetical protein BOX15_Mlig017521g3 [Macrostomum lignano]|uniref:5-formyltetrahydrofolate cyclo-ligase n=1 Tax=Macrostomum lignano TaxID=282301 RepID=A0A267ERL4_9PLAT|nr:hypothetical protein BOX15_Mlig019500g3 [Macrostomum lignano]PAA65531.1 hypothetical protein BOX15_Mlig017521g3 [Macrostomum lignano]
MSSSPTAAAAVKAAKSQLRSLIKSRLAALSAEQRSSKSGIIVQKLLASDRYRSAKRISVYLSMPEEVDTAGIVADIFNSGRRLFVPRYSRGGGMEMLAVSGREDLASLPVTKWGIRQPGLEPGSPAREEGLENGGLDLIIVPGLAFCQADGARLGRGMGYYDRYLARARAANPACAAVAIAFSDQLVDSVPTGDSDQPLDDIVTD